MGGGFSTSRLQRFREALSGYVESGYVPGLVALLARGDEVHVEVLGTLHAGGAEPMRRDAIFRIASITKAIAASAVLMLVEEGRLRLGDAVDEWLPELANRRVLRTLASPLDDTVPARRPITVRDVLTYTMGFGSVMAPPGTHPIQKAIREQAIGGDGPKLPGQQPGPDEWLRRLGALPLIAQPGERWMYHVSGDLLGVLVARVSGRSFGAFLEERLFGPLGMADTAFHVPPDKIPRLPTFYRFDREVKALAVFDGVTDSAWRTPPAFESGGGGLASTIDDYCTFLRMLLHKGRHGRGALLSRATVELMTSDQLTSGQRVGAELFFGSFSSWGLGVAVDIRREEIFHWPGRFGWTGGFGTMAYADPANALVGILFTQRLLDSPEPPRLFTDFWNLAYAAMD